MPREIEGEVQECASCGWRHRPSQACPKTKPPKGPLTRQPGQARGPERSVEELVAPIKAWEIRSQAEPTTREDSGRQCPNCAQPIVVCRNFLGIVWEEVGAELWDEHQRRCVAPRVQALPDLRPPRRAGLPYPDD